MVFSEDYQGDEGHDATYADKLHGMSVAGLR